MKSASFLIILLCVSLFAASLPDSSYFYTGSAVIETDSGAVRITLFEKDCPVHAARFKENVKNGYYNGKYFNRIVPDFVIQAGRNDKDDSVLLDPEISKVHFKGAVGAARTDDISNPEMRSDPYEFYICLYSQPDLDGKYTVFGRVAEGFDTVEKIGGAGSENGVPQKKIMIRNAYLETYFDSEKYEYYKRSLNGECK